MVCLPRGRLLSEVSSRPQRSSPDSAQRRMSGRKSRALFVSRARSSEAASASSGSSSRPLSPRSETLTAYGPLSGGRRRCGWRSARRGAASPEHSLGALPAFALAALELALLGTVLVDLFGEVRVVVDFDRSTVPGGHRRISS